MNSRSGPEAAPATVIDAVSTRFGIRTVVVDGYKILLNGQRLYLAGCKDTPNRGLSNSLVLALAPPP